jgi:hypothetical protein
MLRTNLQLYFNAGGLSQTTSAFFVVSRYKCKHENREFLTNFGSSVMIRGLVWRLQKFRLSLLDGVISLMTADWRGEKVLIRIVEAPDREEGHFV